MSLDLIRDPVGENLKWLLDTLSREALGPDIGRTTPGAFQVYDFHELEDQSARIGYPCVGVVYLGLFATGGTGQGASKPSSSQLDEMFFELYCIGHPEHTADEGERFLTVIELLARVRNLMVAKRSDSTKRQWRFVSERPFELGGRIAYVQRWANRVPIV